MNISHKMFIMLREELNAPDRKFNFICTHDSMMSAMLAAMRVKPYELPSSIEKDTPIGFQIVLEKWRKGGRSLGTVSLVYNTIEQIREESPARMVSNIPAKVKLEFEGLKADSEGYYQWKDIEDLINHTISAYDLTAKGENPFK